MDIRLAHETISRRELVDAAEFLLSGQVLTKAGQTESFEEEFAASIGAKHAVYVNSGSSANLLVAASLRESGTLRNLKVICPAVSWVTTVTPFMHLGYEVILCDAEESSLGVDPLQLESLLRLHEPSILVIVHVLGHPNQMEKILELCSKYDVILIEDTCEALGSTSEAGESLGTLGLAGTYSFYYGHHISTIEGGMVATDDFDLWQIMRSMRSHGWSRDLDPGTRETLQADFAIDDFQALYTFFFPGFNFRSTDFQAFIGRGQLKKVDEIASTREKNFHAYRSRLGDYWFQNSPHGVLSSFAFGTAVRNRLETARALNQAGIEVRPLICGNIARHPFWLGRNSQQSFRVADFVHDFGIYLPNHASLGSREIARVCETFRNIAVPIFPDSFLDKQASPDS